MSDLETLPTNGTLYTENVQHDVYNLPSIRY